MKKVDTIIEKNGKAVSAGEIHGSRKTTVTPNGKKKSNSVSGNISARKRAAQEMALLLDNTEECFVLVDTQMRIVIFNKQFQAFCNQNINKEVKKDISILDLANADRREMLGQIYARVFAGEKIEMELEMSVYDRPGTVFSNRFKPAYDENGNIIGAALTVIDITEKNKARELLLASERRLRALVENSNDAIAILSDKGYPLYVSSSVEGVMGYREEEILKMDILQMIHPDDLDIVYEGIMDAMGNPGITGHAFICRVMHKSGNWRWIETRLTNMLHDPAIAGIIDNFRDVTDKMNAEKIIREERHLLGNSEEKTRLIMNAALDAIIWMDTNGTITFWNPQAEKIFGWKADEVTGRGLSETIIPDRLRAFHDGGIRRYLETGHGPALNVLLELSAINKEGKEFPIELTILPIRQEKEEFFCAFLRDITQRKIIEQQTIIANERYEMVHKATNDAIYEWDIINNNTYWGEGYETLFGHERNGNEASPASWLDNLHPDEKQYLIDSTNQAFGRKKTSLTRELRFRCADGSYKTVFDKLSIRYDNDGKPLKIFGAMQDITELKENETSVRELNEQLNKRAEELAASNSELERFAYVASHDLQEPLRMVSSFLQLLQKKYMEHLDDTGIQYINFAVDGAERMKRLILDLLEYSRVGTNQDKMVKTDIGELVKEVLDIFNTKIQETNAIIRVENMPVAKVNSMQIAQLLQNLVGNALKYNTAIVPEISIGCENKGDSWQFHIKDNGIGIDPKFYKKIFIIFQRLHNKNQFSGTGIGLAICKKIVDKHGGRIWVESAVGKGSTFFFTIKK